MNLQTFVSNPDELVNGRVMNRRDEFGTFILGGVCEYKICKFSEILNVVFILFLRKVNVACPLRILLIKNNDRTN